MVNYTPFNTVTVNFATFYVVNFAIFDMVNFTTFYMVEFFMWSLPSMMFCAHRSIAANNQERVSISSLYEIATQIFLVNGI